MTDQVFRKARPDSLRLPAVPRLAYDYLGGIEAAAPPLLTLGWLLGGAVVTEPKTVVVPRGTVEIGMNQVWGSVQSMRDDVLAAVGRDLGRSSVETSLRTLTRAGFVRDLGAVFPETRGKYGKMYEIRPDLLVPDQEHMDIVRGYQMFHYGDPAQFKIGEIVVGDLHASARVIGGKFVWAERFAAQVATEGMDEPAFRSVGLWRAGEAGDPNAPVFIPMFTIDIDRRLLSHAWTDTAEIVRRLKKQGFDLDRCFVSFSGSKGFHVQITADQLGCPVFADSVAAREMARRLADSICYGLVRDVSVDSPRSLIRLTGSTHASTGEKKVTWTAAQFGLMSPPEIVALLDQMYRGFTFPNPRVGEAVAPLVAKFEGMSRYAALHLYDKARRAERGGGTAGHAIQALLPGVAEGDNWHADHVGRSKAAFVLACWLAENKQTGDPVLDNLPLDNAMEEWNQRNSPPLRTAELRSSIASGVRKVNPGRKPGR